MPECTACHTQNKSGRFCIGCGAGITGIGNPAPLFRPPAQPNLSDLSKQTAAPAAAAGPAKFCGNCGTANDGANFCMSCGTDLRSSPPKSTPAPAKAAPASASQAKPKAGPAPTPAAVSSAPSVNKPKSQVEAEVMAEIAAEKAQRAKEGAEYDKWMKEETARQAKESTDAYLAEAAKAKANAHTAWEKKQAEQWAKAAADEKKWADDLQRQGEAEIKREHDQVAAMVAEAKSHGSPCAACRKLVSRVEGRVEFFGKTWHEACFACAKCGVKMTPARFIPDPVSQACYCSPAHVPQQWA